ncbi:MAG TPA: hypothetical protein V6C58_09250 [Allocoleopsis sp.]
MPKKSKEPAKTPTKTLDLDKKIDAIKGEIDKIIEDEEQQIEEEIKQPIAVAPPVKKQPKIIEEIVEEEEPEPVIIRKIIKKKPKQIIEEIVEEEDNEPVKEEKPKKKENRGRPFGSIKKPKEEYNNNNNIRESKNRNRFDTILDEGNLELLRREMKNEMKRRLMTSLFD